MSVESGWTILLVDRSESRLKNHTGGKIGKTLKTDGNLDVFC